MGEMRNEYKILMAEHEVKRLVRRPRRRWEDNIRMYLMEIGWGGVDWMRLAQDRDRFRAHVNMIMNFQVP
jgi:hypothetical protein